MAKRHWTILGPRSTNPNLGSGASSLVCGGSVILLLQAPVPGLQSLNLYHTHVINAHSSLLVTNNNNNNNNNVHHIESYIKTGYTKVLVNSNSGFTYIVCMYGQVIHQLHQQSSAGGCVSRKSNCSHLFLFLY